MESLGETRSEGAARRRGDITRARQQELLDVAARHERRDALMANTARSYLTRKFADSSVTLRGMANEAGVSPSALGRAVRALEDDMAADPGAPDTAAIRDDQHEGVQEHA